MTENNKILWKPNPGPQEFALSIDDSVFEILYGGARGGGKTEAGIIWLLKGVVDPDFTGLVIRRNSQDLRQWVTRAMELYQGATVTGKPGVIKFKNGARIYLGHLKDKDSYTAYQGNAYQRIIIEEAGQIPEEELYMKLISSARSTNSIRPQIFLSCNPLGPGHGWLKKRFQIGTKPANKSFTDPVSGRKRIFVPALVTDNQVLMEKDPEYIKTLESLPEPLRSAWLNGDFSTLSGQFFQEWDPNHHIKNKKECEALGFNSENNNTYIGIDWGWASYYAVVWCQVTPDNRVFFYRELYGRETHPADLGELISQCSGKENITMSLIDPSCYTKNPMSYRKPETQMYSEASIANAIVGDPGNPWVPNLHAANNQRVLGWRNMCQMMKVEENRPPNFIIVEGTCPNLIRTIPDMIFDDKNQEDLWSDHKEDHLADAARYALSHIQAPSKVKKRQTRQERIFEDLTNPTPTSWTFNWKD